MRIVGLVHSGVTRAAETAAIIAKALPMIVKVDVDPMLAEDYPCIPEPCRVEVRPALLVVNYFSREISATGFCSS